MSPPDCFFLHPNTFLATDAVAPLSMEGERICSVLSPFFAPSQQHFRPRPPFFQKQEGAYVEQRTLRIAHRTVLEAPP